LPSSRTLVISVAAFRTSDLGSDNACTFTCTRAAEKPLSRARAQRCVQTTTPAG
jgi:hypothetical protein